MSRTSFIERYVMPAALKIGGQKHVLSVRDGIILNMPFMLIGSFFLIFAYLPIPGYGEMMTSVFGDAWRDKMLYPVKATYDIMALLSAFGIAYRLAEKYRTLDPLSAGAMSLVAFVMTIPQVTLFTPADGSAAQLVKGVLPVGMIGSQGLFVAIVISLLSTEIYRLVASRNLVIRMPEGVPPAVAKSFLALIPGFCVLAVVLALRLIVEASPFGDINSMITTLIGIPMSHVGGSLPGMIISVILIGILWTLGLHGDTIVLVFIRPVWLSNMSENLEAFQNGLPIPHIITQQFYDLWIAPGGTGALLGLVIFMLLRSRSQQMKQLGENCRAGSAVQYQRADGIWHSAGDEPVLLPAVYFDAGPAGDCLVYRDGHRAGDEAGGDCAAVYHAYFYERLSGDGRAHFRRGASGGEPGDLAGDLLSVLPGMGSPEGERRAGVRAAGSQRDAVCGRSYLKHIPGGGA